MVKCLPQISLREGTLKAIKNRLHSYKNIIPCSFQRDRYYRPNSITVEFCLLIHHNLLISNLQGIQEFKRR